MKKVNFLSNLWSLLVGSRKDDGSTRLRVVFDSFTCRLRVCPLKLVSVLAILLSVGVGNAWGTENTVTWTISGVATTCDGSKKVNTNLTATKSPSTETGTWKAVSSANSYAGSSSGAQLGSKSYSFNGTISLSGSTAITSSVKIKQIVITCRSGGSYTIQPKVGGSNFALSQSINSSSVTDKTFTNSTGMSGDIVIQLSTSATKYFNVSGISVTYEETGGGGCTSITPSLSYSTDSIAIGGTSSSPTLTGNTGSGSVSYASSNTSVATVNSSTGVVTGVATGDVTITASIGASGSYCSGSATATVKVRRGITYYIGSTSYTVGGIDGNKLTNTLPMGATSCDTEKNPYFYGWKEGSISGSTTTPPTLLSTETVSSSSAANTYYAVFTDWFQCRGGTKDSLKALPGLTANGLDAADYVESHSPYRVKLDATGDYVIITTIAQPAKVSIGVKMIGGNTTSSITVQESSTVDGTFTDVETLSISGAQNDIKNLETSKSFKSTTRAIKLYFTKGSNVGLGPITIEGSSATKYSTTCCTELGQPATLTLDKTAYTITATWTATSGGHEDGYSVQLYNSSSVAQGDPVEIDCSSDCDLEHEFTSLSANTTYYVGVTPTYSGGTTYCATGTEKKVSVTTNQVYQVTYNGNNKTSGTVPTDANYYEAGDEVTVAANPLSRSGYTNNGWNTENDGSGDPYAGSGSATMTMPAANVTLYAAWIAKKDYYIDRMHGNWDSEHTVEVNGVVYNCYLREGAGYTRPTLTDNEGGSNSCVTGHSHFLGWVIDSKIGAQGQLLTGYTIYAGGSSGTSSTDGTVYWAVWAEDE